MTAANIVSRGGNRTYFLNIAWSWLSVVALLFSGIFFTRILILTLGKSRFGIWTVAVSLVEYFWMIDLGFRPATVKFSAEYYALQQFENLNRLLNTALAYSVTAGLCVLVAVWFGADRISALLNIHDPDSPALIRAVGLSWAGGLVFNIFAATLEGLQRFDLSNRISIVTTLLRSGVSVLVVLQGYGLREMGWVLLASQTLGYAMMYFSCRRIFPQLRLSLSLVDWPMARTIWGYAHQVIPGIVGARLAQGSYPSIISISRSVQSVTYFSQTQRMMEYAADAISRVGLVTAPRVSEWQALGKRREIVELARLSNCYCLTLWGLWASFLLVYGHDLCRIWIDRDFADNVAPLLPFFLGAYTMFMGQFISAAVLMGIGRYRTYSLALLVESLAGVGLMSFLVPRFGLAGGVAGMCALLAVTRCLILSRLFAAEFEIGQLRYLWDIFHRPVALMVTGSVLLLLCRRFLWSGETLASLIRTVAAFAVWYVAGAFFFVVEKEQRQWVVARMQRLFGAFAKPSGVKPSESAKPSEGL
jgi:O-antigen/teichoic acid export membrane protein